MHNCLKFLLLLFMVVVVCMFSKYLQLLTESLVVAHVCCCFCCRCCCMFPKYVQLPTESLVVVHVCCRFHVCCRCRFPNMQGVPRAGLDEGGQDGENPVHHEDQPALQQRQSPKTKPSTHFIEWPNIHRQQDSQKTSLWFQAALLSVSR